MQSGAIGFRVGTITGLWCLTAVVLIVMSTEQAEGKVRCYVCSWAYSPNPNITNNDTCSTNNFKPETAGVVDCDGGCEASSYKDAKNDKLLRFYRNCVATSSGNNLQEGCSNSEEKVYHMTNTCECTSDLCNASPKILPYFLPVGFSMFIAHILFPSMY